MAQTIIELFKQRTGISDNEWNKICRRYYNRNYSTLIEIISKECGKTSKSVKAELEIEFERVNKIKNMV